LTNDTGLRYHKLAFTHMKDRVMLRSNPSSIWGFAREWCLTVPLFFRFCEKAWITHKAPLSW
jgi:hypothetical protein